MNTNILAFLKKVSKSQIVTVSLAVILLSPVCYLAAKAVKDPAQLTFLTWEGYIDKNVVTQFETEYQAKINFIYFESDDARNEIVISTSGAGYDLLLVDDSSILFYQKLGWVLPFNGKLNPNINYSLTPKLAQFNDLSKTCIPYTWGTTGLAYRTDLVPMPITSWKQIFSPHPALHGKILMSNMGNEVVGMALKSLGYSMASSNLQQLEQARQLLLAQVPAVAGYSPVVTDPQKAKLVTGEASVILTYSGDALMLKALEPRIEYIIPEEGGAVWADFICLSAQASNAQLAHRFINFINRPQQAANNAMFIYGATTNAQAEKLLPSDFINNPIIYPNEAQIAKSETYSTLPIHTIKIHNSIMRELKRAHK